MKNHSEENREEKEKRLKKLKIAAIQMVSSTKLEENLNSAANLIADAAAKGAKLCVLPEYFASMPENSNQRRLIAEEDGNGRVQSFLAEQSLKHKVWIVGGSHPIFSKQENKFYGRCYVFNESGEQVVHYDKMHLFDVAVDDKHGRYCESDYTAAGTHPVVFDSPWGKVGVAICYDVRFPEYFRCLSKLGAELIVIPAAFTEPTGKAHWHEILKVRAVENLSYLVASAQGGEHQNGRTTFGHSCIYSPWGDLLDSLELGEGVVSTEIDFDYLHKLRNEFPALTHRRL